MRTNTVRQRLLEFLGRRPAATAAQIGTALGISAASVRHHLTILIADGRVAVAGLDVKAKRGRPQKMYRLSERLLGNNLGALADSALDAWLGGKDQAVREAEFSSLGVRLSKDVRETDVGLSPSRLLERLTDKLNGMHYQARWEAGSHGPRIVLGHCPYAAIIETHPELCRMDASLLGEVMNADAEQVSKIDQMAPGTTQCIFVLRQRVLTGDD